MTAGDFPWPFKPIAVQSLEEADRWWNTCYVENNPLAVTIPSSWRIISGIQGSGKSVVMARLRKNAADSAFIVNYPPERWPASSQAFVPDGNHLAQILALAGLALRKFLSECPDKIKLLSQIQREFLCWLVEKYDSRRAFMRWVDLLDPGLQELFANIQAGDLFETTSNPRDIAGQVEELVSLCRQLGYNRVLILADLNRSMTQRYASTLLQLYDSIDLMQHPNFTVVVALDPSGIIPDRLLERAHDRLSLVNLSWDEISVREVADRHLCAAQSEEMPHLENLMSSDLLTHMGIRVEEEFRAPVPEGWVALVESALYASSNHPGISQKSFALEDKAELLWIYYTRHMPLWFSDEPKGVWRGPRFIQLTDQLYEFMQVLKNHKGRPVYLESEGMNKIAKNKTQLHLVVSRTREEIEPAGLPKNKWVYIFHQSSEGYWLENFV